MVVFPTVTEQFVLRQFIITVTPDYLLRLPTATVVCIDQSELTDVNKALIEAVCEHDEFGMDNEMMYVVIPDNHKPFICMFPGDMISDEELQHDVEQLAQHDNVTEYCRIGFVRPEIVN